MSTPEDDIVGLSAIEHWAYCPRQCALIHVEQLFEENVFTLQGSELHRRPDEPLTTWEGDRRIERAVPLWSDRLGLAGRADTVEFGRDGCESSDDSHCSVRPVEYKRGARAPRRHDDLQLCAQALCLEEMLGVPVGAGALFYHASRRQREVVFTEELRAQTRRAILQVRELLASGGMPPPVNDARCRNCSLNEVCLPEALATAGQEEDPLFATDLVEEDAP